LLLRQTTPEPTNGSGGGNDGLLWDTAGVAWGQLIDILKWLGGVSLNLVWAGIIVGVLILVTGRLRRRLRTTLEARNKGRNNLPALLDNLLQIGVYIFAAIVAFTALGADSAAFVQAFGLITAAVSLSLTDVLKNFVAGLYLLAEQPFSPGDRLAVASQIGTVEQVNIRTTVLRNDKAEQVLVPNYQVFSTVVSNLSAYRLRTLTIEIAGVKGEPDAAISGVERALANVSGLSATPPRVDLTKVGPDGCELYVTIWFPQGGYPRREIIQHLRTHLPDATLTIST
jgi:small-conductance mechanosensitive channel